MFIREAENENLYFATRVELKINDVIYRPSICYKVPALSKKNLEKLALEGKVVFFEEKVRFVNGVAVSIEDGKIVTPVSSIVNKTSSKKKAK